MASLARFGKYLASIWQVFGKYLARFGKIWQVLGMHLSRFGKHLASMRQSEGQAEKISTHYLASILKAFGKYLASILQVFDKDLASIWQEMASI